MFLTTNRIGSFDDAFLSRIHVGLHYKALTDLDREQIWKNNFDRLELDKREPPISAHSDAVRYVSGDWKKNGVLQEDLINIQWNGREIRNGMSEFFLESYYIVVIALVTVTDISDKAFQTALALASFATNGKKKKDEKPKEVVLRAEHIQSVVKMSKEFKIFVNETKKAGDEESRARAAQLRGFDSGFVSKESSSLGTPARR